MFQLEAAQELFHKLERCIWLQCLVKACKVQTSSPGQETIVGGCQLENFHPISQWLEGSKDVVQVPVVIVTWAHLDVFQQENFGVPVTDGIYESPESNHGWCILHRSKQQRWLKRHTWLKSTLTWHLTCLTSYLQSLFETRLIKYEMIQPKFNSKTKLSNQTHAQWTTTYLIFGKVHVIRRFALNIVLLLLFPAENA